MFCGGSICRQPASRRRSKASTATRGRWGKGTRSMEAMEIGRKPSFAVTFLLLLLLLLPLLLLLLKKIPAYSFFPHTPSFPSLSLSLSLALLDLSLSLRSLSLFLTSLRGSSHVHNTERARPSALRPVSFELARSS